MAATPGETYHLLLTGALQRLSDAYGEAAAKLPTVDFPCRAIFVRGRSLNAGAVFLKLGSKPSAVLTDLNAGLRVEPAVALTPYAPLCLWMGDPVVKLSEFWLTGTLNEYLVVTVRQ